MLDDKIRTCFTLTKEMKKQLQEQAEREDRTLNSLIVTALQQYLKGSQQ